MSAARHESLCEVLRQFADLANRPAPAMVDACMAAVPGASYAEIAAAASRVITQQTGIRPSGVAPWLGVVDVQK